MVDAVSENRRLMIWKCWLEIIKSAHAAQMPGRPFGPDIALMMLLGAVVVSKIEGKRATISKLSGYLELPRETVRRSLNVLVKMGLIERQDHHYWPSTAVTAAHIDAVTRMIKKIAADL